MNAPRYSKNAAGIGLTTARPGPCAGFEAIGGPSSGRCWTMWAPGGAVHPTIAVYGDVLRCRTGGVRVGHRLLGAAVAGVSGSAVDGSACGAARPAGRCTGVGAHRRSRGRDRWFAGYPTGFEFSLRLLLHREEPFGRPIEPSIEMHRWRGRSEAAPPEFPRLSVRSPRDSDQQPGPSAVRRARRRSCHAPVGWRHLGASATGGSGVMNSRTGSGGSRRQGLSRSRAGGPPSRSGMRRRRSTQAASSTPPPAASIPGLTNPELLEIPGQVNLGRLEPIKAWRRCTNGRA
jgi:hypothetical protein